MAYFNAVYQEPFEGRVHVGVETRYESMAVSTHRHVPDVNAPPQEGIRIGPRINPFNA